MFFDYKIIEVPIQQLSLKDDIKAETFEEGELAILTCDVDSVNENTRIYWRKLHDHIDEDFSRRIHLQLFIYHIKFSHAGFYACYNVDGRELRRFNVTVIQKATLPLTSEYTTSLNKIFCMAQF